MSKLLQPPKYLAKFLAPKYSEDMRGQAPTKPTEPPSDRAKVQGYDPRPTYGTYKTSKWDEARGLRWGPAVNDSTPGLIVDEPDRERMIAALESADPHDPYAVAERVAIQTEAGVVSCGHSGEEK